MELLYLSFLIVALMNSELINEATNAKSEEATESTNPDIKPEVAAISENPDGSDNLIEQCLSELENTAARYWNFFRRITNSSKIYPGRMSAINGSEALSMQHPNGTKLSSKRKQRFKCFPKNITNTTVGSVKLVNNSYLQEFITASINKNNSTTNETSCVLVLFYASWCSFSSALAPHYNALGRLFPQLEIVAIDASSFKSINSRYGIMGVPAVSLFNKGNLASVKLNDSEGNVHDMATFLQKFGGLAAPKNVEVLAEDYIGPLPCTITPQTDHFLHLAWLFICICVVYGFSKSTVCHSIIDAIQVNWQEVEAQHEHVD